jgi:hypothetical protein
MYCQKCGQENLDGARFCRKCGTPLTSRQSDYEPKPTGNASRPYTDDSYGQRDTQSSRERWANLEEEFNSSRKIHVPSLILSFIGLVFAILLPLVTYPCSIVGFVLGIKKRNTHSTTIAIVVCIIGLVLASINSATGAFTGASDLFFGHESDLLHPDSVANTSANEEVTNTKGSEPTPYQNYINFRTALLTLVLGIVNYLACVIASLPRTFPLSLPLYFADRVRSTRISHLPRDIQNKSEIKCRVIRLPVILFVNII